MSSKSTTLERCSSLLSEGKLGEAIQLVRLSQQESATSQGLSFAELAEFLCKMELIDRALDDPTLVDDALAATALGEIGEALYKSKHFPVAIRVLQKAKRFDETSRAVRETLSRSLNASGDGAGARIEAYALLPMMVGTKDDLIRIYSLYRDLNLKELAQVVGVKLLALEPGSIEIRRSLINLLLDMKEMDKVRSQLAIFKDSPGLERDDLLFAARSYLWLGACAETEANSPRRSNVSDKPPRFLQAEAYLKSSPRADNDTAALLAERAAADGGTDFASMLIMIQASFPTRNARQLRVDVQSLMDLSKTPEQYADVAELWVKLGRVEEAAEAARRGVSIDKLNSKIPMIRVRLANILCDIGRHEDARECLRPVDVAAVQGGAVLGQFHQACFRAHLDDVALASVKALLKADPNHASFRKRAALLSMVNYVSTPDLKETHAHVGWFGRLFGRSRRRYL